MKYYNGLIGNLSNDEIFVFGSNPEGRHGAGAAKIAKDNYGAIYGKGRGIQGNSYGLVTKNLKAGYIEKSTGIMYPISGSKSVLEYQIIDNIKELLVYINKNRNKTFFVAYTNNGYNLNGYTPEQIFTMFYVACEGMFPSNIRFSDSFKVLYEKLNIKNNVINFNIDIVNIKLNPEIINNPNYIYCGNGSALENPFSMNNKTEKEYKRVYEEYKIYIYEKLKDVDKREQLNKIWKIGKTNGEVFLGCNCLSKYCYCDIILKILKDKQIELSNKYI